MLEIYIYISARQTRVLVFELYTYISLFEDKTFFIISQVLVYIRIYLCFRKNFFFNFPGFGLYTDICLFQPFLEKLFFNFPGFGLYTDIFLFHTSQQKTRVLVFTWNNSIYGYMFVSYFFRKTFFFNFAVFGLYTHIFLFRTSQQKTRVLVFT